MENGCRIDVAFVVVTYNAESFIEKCLRSIFLYRPTGFTFAVVLVDNASSDKTLEIVEKIKNEGHSISIITLRENIGFGPANNMGMRSIRSRYYCLLNMDAFLITDSVGPAIKEVQKYSEIAICGLPLIFPNGDPQTYAYGFSSSKKWLLQILGIRSLVCRAIEIPLLAKWISCLPYGRTFVVSMQRPRLDLRRVDENHFDYKISDVDWVCGAAMLIDGDFFLQSNGFDENIFLYSEDEDLCIRAHRYDRRVVAINAAPIVHVFGWGKNKFNETVSRFKYQSLYYFISKNINNPIDKSLMYLLLPLHVFGITRFFLAFTRKK